MTIDSPRAEGNSAPSGPLSRAERCRLIEAAGLTGCHLDRLASVTKHGWTNVRVWLALLDYASITGEGFYGRYETLADRADTNKRYVETILPALEREGLAHKQQPLRESATWWPCHPDDRALLPRGVTLPVEDGEKPSEPRDRPISRDLAEREEPGPDDPISRDLADLRLTHIQRQDDDSFSPEQRQSACEAQQPGDEKGGNDEQEESPAEKNAAREKVSPKVLGYHRGDPLAVGKNEYGEYLLWPHEPLIEAAGSKFIDHPGALDLSFEEAAEVAEQVLADARQDLPPGLPDPENHTWFDRVLDGGEAGEETLAEVREAAAAVGEQEGAPADERIDAFLEADPTEREAVAVLTALLAKLPSPERPSRTVQELRATAARFAAPIPGQVEAWLAEDPPERGVVELDRRLYERRTQIDHGHRPPLTDLEEVLVEMEAA